MIVVNKKTWDAFKRLSGSEEDIAEVKKYIVSLERKVLGLETTVNNLRAKEEKRYKWLAHNDYGNH